MKKSSKPTPSDVDVSTTNVSAITYISQHCPYCDKEMMGKPGAFALDTVCEIKNKLHREIQKEIEYELYYS